MRRKAKVGSRLRMASSLPTGSSRSTAATSSITTWMSVGTLRRDVAAGKGSSKGQPSTATTPRWKARSSSAVVRTPSCTVSWRGPPAAVAALRRSSPDSTRAWPKRACRSGANGAAGRPLIISGVPAAWSSRKIAACAGSAAMKAGTSSITCGPGPAAMMARSMASPATLSSTAGRTPAGRAAGAAALSGRSSSVSGALPAVAPSGAGQTSSSARSNAAASGAASGRSGNTVRRVATTARWRSIMGQ